MSELDDLNELLGESEGFSRIPQNILQTGEHLTRVFTNSGFEGVATFIGKGVLSSINDCNFITPREALDEETEAQVVTEITWSGDRNGKIYILLPESGAKGAIAFFLALAMGTEPDIEGTKLDDEAMDAYGELASTLAQQGAQALRGEEKAGGKINFSVVSNEILDPANINLDEKFGSEDMLCSNGQLTIEGLSPVNIRIFMSLSCTGMEEQASIQTKEDIVGNDQVGAIVDTTEHSKPKRIKNRNASIAQKLPVPVIVVLATTKMRVENVKELAPGSIIEFKKFAGEFLDVCAENTKFSEGEVVIVNQHFGIQLRRMTPTIPPPRLLK